MTTESPPEVLPQLERLVAAFFRSVSFVPGTPPHYEDIAELFMEAGLLIRNVGPAPEVSDVPAFVRARRDVWAAGALTQFHEAELDHVTEVFGNVAHRFSAYEKSGTLNGVAFEAKGMVCTQFVRTPTGWKISAMAWDDERPGLSIPARLGTAG